MPSAVDDAAGRSPPQPDPRKQEHAALEHNFRRITSRRPARQQDTGPFQKTTLCRFHPRPGGCDRGSACSFAHGPQDLRCKPNLRKTSLCQLWAKGRCRHEGHACPWAHGFHELQEIRTEDADRSGGQRSERRSTGAEDPVSARGTCDSCARFRGFQELGTHAEETGARNRAPEGVDETVVPLSRLPDPSSVRSPRECARCQQVVCSAGVFCVRCGGELSERAERHAERPAPQRCCPACRTLSAPSAIFCVECGSKLDEPGACAMQPQVQPCTMTLVPVAFGGPPEACTPWHWFCPSPTPIVFAASSLTPFTVVQFQ